MTNRLALVLVLATMLAMTGCASEVVDEGGGTEPTVDQTKEGESSNDTTAQRHDVVMQRHDVVMQ